VRTRSGAARADAATTAETHCCDPHSAARPITAGVASGDSRTAPAETAAAPTSPGVAYDGQQCRAAGAERGFAQRSAQHFAARRAAAPAAGAGYAPTIESMTKAATAVRTIERTRVTPLWCDAARTNASDRESSAGQMRRPSAVPATQPARPSTGLPTK